MHTVQYSWPWISGDVEPIVGRNWRVPPSKVYLGIHERFSPKSCKVCPLWDIKFFKVHGYQKFVGDTLDVLMRPSGLVTNTCETKHMCDLAYGMPCAPWFVTVFIACSNSSALYRFMLSLAHECRIVLSCPAAVETQPLAFNVVFIL